MLRILCHCPDGSVSSDSDSNPRSWTLDHVSQAVQLALRIQLTRHTQHALEAVSGGQQGALQVSYTSQPWNVMP